MTITIDHTPACGTSRDVPGLIRNSGGEPIVINRPIVVTETGMKPCHPSETVRDLFPHPQRGEFRKEHGAAVVGASGSRIAKAAP